MAVAVRATFIGSSTTTTTSWAPTVTAATGTAAGDVAVVVFTDRDGTAASISDNSGDGVSWNLEHHSPSGHSYIWSKVLVGTHDTKVVTVSGATGSCSGVLAYVSGGITGTLDEALTTHIAGDESATFITPTFADSMVFGAVYNLGNDNAVTGQSWATLGAATATREHLSTGGNDCATALAWKLQAGGPASTGNFTWAQNNGATEVVLFTVAPPTAIVTPSTAALVLTSFAPTVTAGVNVTVTPTTASLTLATFAPTVSTTANITVTPTTATLNLTTFAPTVTATGAFAQGVGGFMIIG